MKVKRMEKIAVDAMGGDFAPLEIVLGAIWAVRDFHIPVVLVGREEEIRRILKEQGMENDPLIEIQNATEVIEMGEHPGMAYRKKRDASVSVGAKLVRKGLCGALVAPGSTGAAVTAGLLGIGRVPGIDRPAILTPIPNQKGGYTYLIDSGASTQPKAVNYMQNALLGYWYAKKVCHIEDPKVGLLNIGTEATKGSPLVAEVFEMMQKQNHFHFAGNCEGRDIPTGDFDVVVTDGFTGNVVLKFGEGVGNLFKTLIKDSVMKGGLRAKLGALLLKPALKEYLMKRVDYAEYGGAPLLGIKGGLVICHGASKAKAIRNAVHMAERISEEKIFETVAKAIAEDEALNAKI